MNDFEIQLKNKQSLFLKDENDIAGLLKETFLPFSENYFKLSYEIQREFKAGGSPQVTRMEFDRVHFSKDTQNGSFRVMLDINFTFGCEDVITEKEDQTSEWTFAIDANINIITFHSSPYIDCRSTVDEF